MSGAAAKAPLGKAPPRPARKPRATGKPLGKLKPPELAVSRLGRLGSWGWAAVLGTGAVTLSPLVHAFWGELGVLGLLIFGLGFLLGRWTAA